MIYGIGVDVTSVSRVEKSLERLGERFMHRILAVDEREDYCAHSQPARFLAKRFAIKEAASKALGTGIRDGVSFHDFITSHDSLGRPLLHVAGRADELSRSVGIVRYHLSLSDEGDLVAAYVVCECDLAAPNR